MSVKLSVMKSGARSRLANAIKRLQHVLQEQRLLFVKSQPDHCLASANAVAAASSSTIDDIKEASNRKLEIAYKKLEAVLHNGFIAALAEARDAEVALDPASRIVPAVLVYSVSAPGYSFKILNWSHSPFPRIVRVLNDALTAAFTSPDITENRAKRMYSERLTGVVAHTDDERPTKIRKK